MEIKLQMPAVAELVRKKGLDPDGHVQMFLTMDINRRIGKFMPHLSGTLETKLKHIRSGTQIEILGPFAKYQYYGKVMAGPPPKVVTDKDLQYTKTFNPQAGPFWDKRLMAAEGKAIEADVQCYIERGEGSV